MLRTEMAVAEVVVKRLGAAWFIGVLLLSFGALYLIATTSGPELQEQLQKNADHALTIINIVVLLLVTVIAATEIPYDITGRVLLVLLAKPIRRYQYVVGKYLGVAGVGIIYVLLCEAFSLFVLFLMGYQPDAAFFNISGAILLRVVIGAGFAVFLSATFSEVPTIAGCIGYGVLTIGVNMFALMLIKSELPFQAKLALSPLIYAIPSLQTLNAPPTALGDFVAGRSRELAYVESANLDSIMETSLHDLHLSVLYSAAYALFFVACAILFFYRSEKVE